MPRARNHHVHWRRPVHHPSLLAVFTRPFLLLNLTGIPRRTFSAPPSDADASLPSRSCCPAAAASPAPSVTANVAVRKKRTHVSRRQPRRLIGDGGRRGDSGDDAPNDLWGLGLIPPALQSAAGSASMLTQVRAAPHVRQLPGQCDAEAAAPCRGRSTGNLSIGRALLTASLDPPKPIGKPAGLITVASNYPC